MARLMLAVVALFTAAGVGCYVWACWLLFPGKLPKKRG